jgi:hypothetical protein
MNEETVSNLKAEDAKLLELGFTLGQNQTFAVLAGRCSAAHAQGIRRLREEKLYKGCCEKWDDFCPKYLKMSRGEADRIVRLLDEFGPAYFELSQLTRISAATFRAIAAGCYRWRAASQWGGHRADSRKLTEGGRSHCRDSRCAAEEAPGADRTGADYAAADRRCRPPLRRESG